MSYRKTTKFHVYGKSYSTTGVFHNSWKRTIWLFGEKTVVANERFKKICEEEAKGRLTATFNVLYKETNQGHLTLTVLPV